MNLTDYRQNTREQERIAKLMNLVPIATSSVMDAGARDGYVSERLAARGHLVTALDLQKPRLSYRNVECVQGDITKLRYADDSFDLVLCAEVLEHLPPPILATACNELQRVAKNHVLIGVPYRQDTRISQTTCYSCGVINPPWAHVNVFTKDRLIALFPGMDVQEVTLVGRHREYTNALSALLLNLAGNPFGTYDQEEPCTSCSRPLKLPPQRTSLQRLSSRVAVYLNKVQSFVMPAKPLWIHILFCKPSKAPALSEVADNPGALAVRHKRSLQA